MLFRHRCAQLHPFFPRGLPVGFKCPEQWQGMWPARVAVSRGAIFSPLFIRNFDKNWIGEMSAFY